MRDERGITLFESIVVVFLIGLLLYGFVTFYSHYSKGYEKLKEEEQIRIWVMEELEKEKERFKSGEINDGYENKLIGVYKVESKEYKVYSTVKDMTSDGTMRDVYGLVEINVRLDGGNREVEVFEYVSKK